MYYLTPENQTAFEFGIILDSVHTVISKKNSLNIPVC